MSYPLSAMADEQGAPAVAPARPPRLRRALPWLLGLLLPALILALAAPPVLISAAVTEAHRVADLHERQAAPAPAVAAALARLEQAAAWSPPSVAIERARARLELASGDPAAAIAAAERAHSLEPENLAVSADLVEVYLMAGADAQADALVAELGAIPFDMFTRGAQEYDRGRYRAAYAWLSAVARLRDQPEPAARYRRLLAAVHGGTPPAGLDDLIFPVGPGVRIIGGQLRWTGDRIHTGVRFGDELAAHPGRLPGVGFLWWTRPASAVVRVEAPGLYRLSVRARRADPARPVGLRMIHNSAPVAAYQPAESWAVASTMIALEPGVHQIGVQAGEGGASILVDWIRLTPMGAAPSSE